MSARFSYGLPFGAAYADGKARFRLWAPACRAVTLEFDNGQSLPMQAGMSGWFELEAPCRAGQGYRFRVRDDLAAPDPAARAQRGDVHGFSQVVDPRAYVWRNGDWRGRPWEEMLIYEVHAGAYGAGGSAGGSGGFCGVRERLPELAQLGVSAVELMPVADFSGTRSWGYDGVLPYAPASAYGSPDDLKALIDTAHGLGLCVYLDVVYNHFGPDGNYLHEYAPTFFDAGQQSPWGAAIDFKQPVVRDFFTQNALYWLMEYRFDGLRLDAVHAIGDPGWLDEMAARVRQTVEPDRIVHLVLENEHNTAAHLAADFDAQWNDDGHNVLHVLLTGEHEGYYQNYREAPTHKLARCLQEGFVYQGEPSPSHDDRPRGSRSGHLPPTAFVLFLQNHDQIGNRAMGDRLSTLVDADALRAAIVLQLLSPQIPLLFMGEEWGSRQPFLFFTDFHDGLADAVREGRRREFKAFSAFADAEARARIPDPNDVQTFTRSIPDFAHAASDADAGRMRAFYQHLIGLRCRELVPRLAGSRAGTAAVVGDKAVTADWHLGDGSLLQMRINLGEQECSAPAPQGRRLAQSREGAADAAAAGRLMPLSTTVYLLADESDAAPAGEATA